MIIISNKFSIMFISFRKIQFNIMYSFIISTCYISITRIFFIINIFWLRISFSIYIILIYGVYKINI